MSRLIRLSALLVLVTALVAAAGGWIGVQVGLRQAHTRSGLDEIVHHEMNLSREQDGRIGSLEADYGARRRALETEMRQANADLANAIASEHAYGPKAQQAVERFHKAMGTLQEDTIRHVLAMRAVMTPDQAKRFDALVDRALKPAEA